MSGETLPVTVQVLLLLVVTFIASDAYRDAPRRALTWFMILIAGVCYYVFFLGVPLPQFVEVFA